MEDFFGFSYDGNTYADIYAGWETFVSGINGQGEVVGYYQPEIDNNHGFIYDGTWFTDFTYPGAYDTYIAGVSESGTIVGSYTLPVYDPTFGSVDIVSSGGEFLWDGADFQSLDFPGSVADVNSNGWIVGSYTRSSGQFYQYAGILGIPIGNAGSVNTPVPEPAAMLLLGGAMAGIFGVRRRLA